MQFLVSITELIFVTKRKLATKLKEETRSNTVYKNIILTVLTKGGSIIIGLILVPMTIDYINSEQYGIWLTISSIITWVGFFDIGLGNGLRNKLTAAISNNEILEAKRYISTTYATLFIISTILLLSFNLFNPYINWGRFLNLTDYDDEIRYVLLIAFCSFCIQFIVQIINVVLNSTHQSAKVGLIYALGQLSILIILFIVRQSFPGSLRIMVWILAITPIAVSLLFTIYYFKTSLKHIAPSLSNIDFSYTKKIFNVGGHFFIIQIGALILFQTNNIIITRIQGATGVTEFNIVYKLFSILIMMFNIIMAPYWSAFTEAHIKGDYKWMNQTMTKLKKLWIYSISIFIPIAILASDKLYKIWIGQDLNIPLSLTISMGLYTICYTAMLFNCTFLNGVGKLKIQLILYILVSIINIPLSIFFCNILGVTGIAISNVIICALMGIIVWIQSNKIINQSAQGIWNK